MAASGVDQGVIPSFTTESRGNNEGQAGNWRESLPPIPIPPGLPIDAIPYLIELDIASSHLPDAHAQYLLALQAVEGLRDAIREGRPIARDIIRDPTDIEYQHFILGLEDTRYEVVPYTYPHGGDEFYQRCLARYQRQREDERIQILEEQVDIEEDKIRQTEARLEERRSTVSVQRTAIRRAREEGDLAGLQQAFMLEPLEPPPPPRYTAAWEQYRASFVGDRSATSDQTRRQQPPKRRRTTGPSTPLGDPGEGPSGYQSRSGRDGSDARQARSGSVAGTGEDHLPPYARIACRARIAQSSYEALAAIVNTARANAVGGRPGPSARQNQRLLEDREVETLRILIAQERAARESRGDPQLSPLEIELNDNLNWYLNKQLERDENKRKQAAAEQKKRDEEAREKRAARFSESSDRSSQDWSRSRADSRLSTGSGPSTQRPKDLPVSSYRRTPPDAYRRRRHPSAHPAGLSDSETEETGAPTRGGNTHDSQGRVRRNPVDTNSLRTFDVSADEVRAQQQRAEDRARANEAELKRYRAQSDE